MYRPEGFDAEEIAHKALRDNESWLEDEHTACVEAGADAMLEGLFKMAKESPTGTFVIDSNEICVFRGDINALKIR